MNQRILHIDEQIHFVESVYTVSFFFFFFYKKHIYAYSALENSDCLHCLCWSVYVQTSSKNALSSAVIRGYSFCSATNIIVVIAMKT